jgi:hypothetical protein
MIQTKQALIAALLLLVLSISYGQSFLHVQAENQLAEQQPTHLITAIPRSTDGTKRLQLLRN